MKAEAKAFYKNASPYKPTFYWIDVEEATMKNMNKGVKAFRDELKKLGAKNVGIYIGTYFMQEQNISTKGFDAVWIPTYGTDSGYYEAAPDTSLDYDLHQYTSQGYLNGFSNPLDLNQIAVTKDKQKTYKNYLVNNKKLIIISFFIILTSKYFHFIMEKNKYSQRSALAEIADLRNPKDLISLIRA